MNEQKTEAHADDPILETAEGGDAATSAPDRMRLAKLRHDLRTPINHVIGYSEILQEDAEGQVPSSFLNDLAKIHSGGHQLLGLINRYLGEDVFRPSQLDIRALGLELRQPATQIIGYSELLLEWCAETEHEEFESDLNRIVEAGRTWLARMEKALLSEDAAEIPAASKSAEAPRSSAQDWVRIQSRIAQGPRATDVFYSEQGTLLLADDDEANRDLLRRRLERLGYTVTACADGREAVDRLREGGFDLVLLDMIMPGLDGHEVLEWMKEQPELQNTPVVMISALDQVESVVRCIELGAEDYLPKPFNPVLLRARIGAALEKKRLRDFEKVYTRQIEEEQKQSEMLLLNVLPRPIADRLKHGESSIVDSFNEVTVLFADLVGFTAMAARVPSKLVVRLLDEVFSAFDALADEHGLEKIKTIGDAYMAVAGLPLPKSDHARATARMALGMLEALARFNAQRRTALAMRIGINTGPVIAGIIGRRKFSYDLWGDTVNTASRMESHGEAGRIHLAASTAEQVRDEFALESRGEISIKGKGMLPTYWLLGRK